MWGNTMKKRFESLRVWQKAHELVLHVYKSEIVFPPNERYGIESQLKSAIVSVPDKIWHSWDAHYGGKLICSISIKSKRFSPIVIPSS
ncbi:MAG: four helix bundle protein [Bacillota bacterium]